METLEVYLNDVRVGRLDDANGSLSFAYGIDYLEMPNGEPLSYALPLRHTAYDHGEIEPFLSNLLPDDIIRTRLGEILGIPRENTFAFLKAIGGDCAGAVAFYPEGVGPEKMATAEYRELSDDEAGRILDNLEQRPLDVGEEGFRISGAGAQDKLIACVRDGKIFLPLNGTPSTDIIKIAIRNYPGSVENEWFCMTLASTCGLNTAECDIVSFGGKRCYVSHRYDREQHGTTVRRLHQEDFCQMLKVDPKHKYESLGGPGIAKSFGLLRNLSLPASDTVELLDRVIFNFIVGNGDAHGKNISVLYRNGVMELAPMYDVMSTAIYPDVGNRMAMKIDDEYVFKWITRGKFVRMGAKIGIGEGVIRTEVEKMSRRISRKLPQLVRSATRLYPSFCYAEIAKGIEQRIAQLT